MPNGPAADDTNDDTNEVSAARPTVAAAAAAGTLLLSPLVLPVESAPQDGTVRVAAVQGNVAEDFEDAFAAAIAEVGGRVEARGLLARLAHHLDLDEPMVDLVREVRAAGVPVALVSNSLGRDCYARVDLDELFDVTVISGQVGVSKPSRRIYAIAADRLGLAPEQCVAIEDSATGVRSAVAAGVPTLAVPHLVEIPQLDGLVVVPDLAAVSLDDLPRLAERARATR